MNAVAGESGLLSVSNGSGPFGISNSIKQRHNEKEHHPVEISCVPDSFEAVKTHSIEAFSETLSRNDFILKEIRSNYFVCDKRHHVISKGSYANIHIIVLEAQNHISDSSCCSFFQALKICTHQENNSF